MGAAYPDLTSRADFIREVVQGEENYGVEPGLAGTQAEEAMEVVAVVATLSRARGRLTSAVSPSKIRSGKRCWRSSRPWRKR